MRLTRRNFLATSFSAAAVLASCSAASLTAPRFGSMGDQRRWAFAHYMTGKGTRRRDHSVQDWIADIRDAKDYGIDGWQFNFGRYEGRFKANVLSFVEALAALGQEAADFRFFPSFDCNQGRRPNIDEILDWYNAFYHHPNHFRLNGLPLLTVWQARHVGDAFFREVKRKLQQVGMPIAFIPWLATQATHDQMGKLFAEWTSMDGFFPWVPGKPADEAVRYNEVAAALCRKYGRTLMAGQGFAMLMVNKAPVYVNKHAAEAITTQMLPLVDGRLSDCHILNVATWNDFGEDHHISPQPPYGPQGGPHPVWGHIGYAAVLKYYLDWWKNGRQPELADDTLAFFHMTQLAREGNPPFPYEEYKPDKAQDLVYVTTILKAPALLTVTSGSQPPAHFQAPAGVSHWRVQAAPGKQSFNLTRKGKEILAGTSSRPIASPPDGPWTWSLHSEALNTRR